MKTREKKIQEVTLIGGLCNFVLMILKFLAGIIGRSGAMIADATHSLSDFITDVVVLLFVRISSKPEDDTHDYGHGKFETMATIIISLMLFAVAVVFFVKSAISISAVINGESIPHPGFIAFVAAAVSIIVKEGLYRYTLRHGKKLNSKAMIANAWHHRSDALSSVTTLIGIGLAYFLGNNWAIMDPIAAIAVSAMIVKVSIDLFFPAINELLECSLPEKTENQILEIIKQDPAVHDPHHLKTRSIGKNIAIEIHIRLDGAMTVNESHEITLNIENRLREKYGPETLVIVHVEPKKTEIKNI